MDQKLPTPNLPPGIIKVLSCPNSVLVLMTFGNDAFNGFEVSVPLSTTDAEWLVQSLQGAISDIRKVQN